MKTRTAQRPSIAHIAPESVAARSRRVRTACVLGALCLFIYLSNVRQMGSWDSIPARLLPFSILRQGNLDLDEFAWLRRLSPRPYFLRQHEGHWFSAYPIGTPILVTPLYLPVTWWLQHHHIDDDDVRFRLVSVVMERLTAAFIVAASVGLVFLTAAALTSTGTAVAAALIYGLGTNTWAVSSQALWQHAMAELGLAGMSLFLIRPNERRNAVAAGTFVALAVLGRPTMLVFGLIALLFMWRERRNQFLPFLILPLAGAGLLLAYSRSLGTIAAGPSGTASFTFPHLAWLVGLLLSPNRGLFVYTPFALLALPALVRPSPTAPRWLTYAPIGVAAYLLLFSAWAAWWGGYCYGPRYLTDLMPLLVLCALPTMERLRASRWGQGLVVALAVWGIIVQAIGVYYDDKSWDALPLAVDRVPARVWDWGDLQIRRAASRGWQGFELGPLIWDTLADPRPALLKPIPQTDLKAAITAGDPLPLRYRGGRRGTLDVRVRNLGSAMWPAFSDYGFLQVLIVYRWWFAGAVVSGEGGHIPLPRTLGPQESTLIHADIDAPEQRGSYELELIIVQGLDDQSGTPGTAFRIPAKIE